MPSGLELFGLVSSIQSTIGLINILTVSIRSFRDQSTDEKDLHLKFETDAKTLNQLLPALKRIQQTSAEFDVSDAEQTLSDDIKIHLDTIQAKLSLKLKVASLDGKHMGARALGSRAAWVVWRKRDMVELERSLFDWIQRVELSYSTLEAGLTGAGRGSSGSEDHIALQVDIYNQIKARHVTSAGLHLARRMPAWYGEGPGQPRQVIIEYMASSYTEHENQGEIDALEQAICDLAKVLVHSEPERTWILRALGYFHDTTAKRFGLIYEIPPSEQWTEVVAPEILTLSDLLAGRPRFSLTARLKLCCDIAKAVLYVHVMDWVHKGLRPDSILFLGSVPKTAMTDANYTHALPPCYVAGFEHSRAVQMHSDRKSDAEWAKNLYRHPNRQALSGNSEYSMGHDIYSVGVVFLEIGLWGNSSVVPFQSQLQLKEKDVARYSPLKMREYLLQLTEGTPRRPGLAAFMGESYADIVRYCLNVSETATGAPKGYQFVQEVWLRLDTIRAAI
ncbi:unnamed protein product [Penicillium manginii]